MIQLSDIDRLPSIPLSEYKRLPNCCAVYFVRSEGEILYIGGTVSLALRWRKHHRYLRLAQYSRPTISWLEVESANREAIESGLIIQFAPPLNRRPNTGAPSNKPTFLLRAPNSLKSKLQRIATEQNRSLHGQIVYMLQQAVKKEKKQ